MKGSRLEFKTRKTRISIDYRLCVAATQRTANPTCGFACVKACRLYGRNILRVEENKPVLAIADPEEIERLDNECMGCEYNCQRYGPGCIRIDVFLL